VGKLKDMWLMPFRLITAVMAIFTSNRNRLRKIKEQTFISSVVKYGALLTAIIWLALALLAKDEDKNRLTESVKQLWSETRDGTADSSPEHPNQN
jgi:hypothetical protein